MELIVLDRNTWSHLTVCKYYLFQSKEFLKKY